MSLTELVDSVAKVPQGPREVVVPPRFSIFFLLVIYHDFICCFNKVRYVVPPHHYESMNVMLCYIIEKCSSPNKKYSILTEWLKVPLRDLSQARYFQRELTNDA